MSTAARAAVFVAALGGAAVALRVLGGDPAAIAGRIEAMGSGAPLAFVGLYAVATVALVPGSVLTLAAGALFGFAGVAYVFVGAMLGLTAAFLTARYAARGAVERRLAGRPRFAAIDRAVAAEGRKIVFLLRLTPVVPFSLLNYILGLTRIGFGDYVLASLGILPGTVLWVYYGTLIRSVADISTGSAPRGTGYYVLLAAGLVATVAVTAVITRAARRALAETAGDDLGTG